MFDGESLIICCDKLVLVYVKFENSGAHESGTWDLLVEDLSITLAFASFI